MLERFTSSDLHIYIIVILLHGNDQSDLLKKINLFKWLICCSLSSSDCLLFYIAVALLSNENIIYILSTIEKKNKKAKVKN